MTELAYVLTGEHTDACLTEVEVPWNDLKTQQTNGGASPDRQFQPDATVLVLDNVTAENVDPGEAGRVEMGPDKDGMVLLTMTGDGSEAYMHHSQLIVTQCVCGTSAYDGCEACDMEPAGE